MTNKKNNQIIYFSGPDGAGKSTVFLMACKILENNNKKIFQLRQYQILTAIVVNLIKNLKGDKRSLISEVGRIGTSTKKRDRDTGGFSWRLRRLIGLIVGLIDINIFGRCYVNLKKLQGYTVLIEQAPLDIFVKRHRPQFKIVENIFAKYLPKPNISILCVANPSNIVARKPELTEKEIRYYYDHINKLYSKSKKFKKIDLRTDQKLGQTELDLKGIILK